MENENNDAIFVNSLVVCYKKTVAVNNLSFTAAKGEVTALLGANGAGKTTTVETLEGYKMPTSGEVKVLGLNPISDKAKLAPLIGIMLQQGGIYPGITVKEALRLFGSFYQNPKNIDQLLDTVGLRKVEKVSYRHLSGGEKQRLSLGLALIPDPQVIFLDEPTAGVDPQGRTQIREIIKGLKEKNRCVVVTTHELDEAERMADTIVLIDNGKLVANGTLKELKSLYSKRQISFVVSQPFDTNALGSQLKTAVEHRSPNEYLLSCEPTPFLISELTGWMAKHNLLLERLDTGSASLEEIFLQLAEPSDVKPPPPTSTNTKNRTDR